MQACHCLSSKSLGICHALRASFAASAPRRVHSEVIGRFESASSWLSVRGHLQALGNCEIEVVISRLGGCFFQSSEYASMGFDFPRRLEANDGPVFDSPALYSNHKRNNDKIQAG